MTSCRECVLFDLDACKDKAGRVLKERVGRCAWVSTEDYPSALSGFHHRPRAGYRQPNDGQGCPCFKKREMP